MNQADQVYSAALRQVLLNGNIKRDRTGVGTLSLTGLQMRFDVSFSAFPILTGKHVNFDALKAELLWILRGSTEVWELRELGTRIWDEWATEAKCAKWGRKEGDLGPTYGHQWRRFGRMYENDGRDEDQCSVQGTDQLAALLQEMELKPFSRRLVLSAWHPYQAGEVDLPPCITQIQLVGRCEASHSTLSCVMDMVVTQRSGDMFLGVPFDLSAHALLLCMLCRATGHMPGRLVMNIGDAHVYRNHIEQARDYLQRKTFKAPMLELPLRKALDEQYYVPTLQWLLRLQPREISLYEYKNAGKIRAQVAV